MQAFPINRQIDQPVCWPVLPYESWADTCATLHMWTQIVGKVRLTLTPVVNHWWNVPLYVSSRGLTTSPIPYGVNTFEIQFDFIDHQLVLQTSQGLIKTLPLHPMSVADFYVGFMALLRSAEIEVHIWKMPVEIPNPIAFDQDHAHASYDPEYAHRFWQVLVSTNRVFHEFRAHFIGKVSPVHFFWGSFDLAVSRFSGRPAPPRENADAVTAEAYSHEVSSVGFWPGSAEKPALFYSYAVPTPSGFADSPVRPNSATYDKQLGEFILEYEQVRQSPKPSTALMDFCQSTYEAAATLGNWDRNSLERPA